MKSIINIPQPCHEDWNKMLPEQKGRHCAACQTTVIDFTKMTDDEIIHHFKKSKGKLCGRFLETQLERKLIAESKMNHWFNLPKFSAAASILFSLLQLPASAQNKNEIKTEQTQVLKNDSLKIDTVKNLPVRDVNSVVPIYQGTPSSIIQIGGNRTRIIIDGKKINSSDIQQNKNDSIRVQNEIIIMGRDINSLNAECVIKNRKQTPWQRFKRKIKRWFS